MTVVNLKFKNPGGELDYTTVKNKKCVNEMYFQSFERTLYLCKNIFFNPIYPVESYKLYSLFYANFH